ncbi:MAG: hypothetical protein WBN59_05025 [Flavobacteriaceae bacterium]
MDGIPISGAKHKLVETLVQFQLRFWELSGQETLIEDLYVAAIEVLNKQ